MRIVYAALLAASIALLCIYSARRHPGLTIDECLASPEAHDGATVCGPYAATVGALTDGGFILRWEGGEIPVRGTHPDLLRGRYVSVRGVFRREGFIEAAVIGVGVHRRLKMAVCVAATLVVLFMLWRRFEWDAGLRALKERTPSDRNGPQS